MILILNFEFLAKKNLEFMDKVRFVPLFYTSLDDMSSFANIDWRVTFWLYDLHRMLFFFNGVDIQLFSEFKSCFVLSKA